jgi:hypothetical protein
LQAQAGFPEQAGIALQAAASASSNSAGSISRNGTSMFKQNERAVMVVENGSRMEICKLQRTHFFIPSEPIELVYQQVTRNGQSAESRREGKHPFIGKKIHP